jgi:hypothetical protein
MSAFGSLVVKITRLVPTDEGQVTTQKRTYFRWSFQTSLDGEMATKQAIFVPDQYHYD